MQRNWSGRNVDLKVLEEEIVSFFKESNFDILTNQTERGSQIIAQGSPDYLIGGPLMVEIRGKPNEFSIELELMAKEKLPHGIITMTLLGAGLYTLQQRFRAQEDWTEFTRDFWRTIDGIITELGGSAEPAEG